MDPITALREIVPGVTEAVVLSSAEKPYFEEFGAAKAEKVRMMTGELLDCLINYLKTASLSHAREDVRGFIQNTPSSTSAEELGVLWTDIVEAAIAAFPEGKNLLRQSGEVFERLIAASGK